MHDRYPREMSGGQRQRICVARALAANPKVMICDEPVSSLDVSIRAQIMNLFLKLRDELGMASLLIAHDLAVVRQAASRVYVMYLGKIVEYGDSAAVYGSPAHPYTQSLLSAVPDPNPVVERNREQILLVGDVPSPVNPPVGLPIPDTLPGVAGGVRGNSAGTSSCCRSIRRLPLRRRSHTEGFRLRLGGVESVRRIFAGPRFRVALWRAPLSATMWYGSAARSLENSMHDGAAGP